MSQEWERAFEVYRDEALALAFKEDALLKPNFSLTTYIREANQTLGEARACWERPPAEGAPPLGAFANFYSAERLARAQGLVHALQHAVGVGLFQRERPEALGPKVKRAQWIIRELRGALTFVMDDGVEDDGDAQVARLRRTTAKAKGSAAAVGGLLGVWVALARLHQERLGALADFDPALLDEGERLSRALLSLGPLEERPAPPFPWAKLRAGLYTLAQRELQALRRVVEHAYRHHDEVLRRFVSAERRRRREKRRGEGVSS